MPKPEIEFVDMDTHYGWRAVEGDTLGIKEKILSFDAETQSYTRLLKFPPGIKTSETLVHDFWEEVLIVEGELMDLAKKQTFGAGFYACRPPGMKHGPYHIPRGCITFEIRYFLGRGLKEGLEGRSFPIWISGKEGEREQIFKMRRMVNSGYTGRDQEKIKKHIAELEKEGVPAPASTPTAYEVISQGITFDTEIEVVGEKTSGEAEFVLLCSGNEVYVGVGSDHTDRELESVSIIKSKQVCPNILSRQVWNLKEVRKNWDTMILRSWVKNERGEKVLYQEAPLSALMSPEDLMKFVQNSLDDGNLDGVVIFSGTIPILTEKIHYSGYFEVELDDPATARRIQCAYAVKVLDYLKGGRG
ncbi:MAG: DUF2848 family protein [Thermodesulfobacteriota bacterium]|nr:DUF2848 family protein [Thermodesulfobacteriota bacterium]